MWINKKGNVIVSCHKYTRENDNYTRENISHCKKRKLGGYGNYGKELNLLDVIAVNPQKKCKYFQFSLIMP